jgi:hypothetical protein
MQIPRKEARPMNAFFRLVVVVSVLSACIVVGTAPAHAQSELLYLAAIIEEVIDQELSAPSLGGPTGIVSMPNAVTPPARTWQAALSYQGMRAPSSGTDQAPDDLSAWSLQAAHRLADTAELWASYSSAADHVGSRTWALGGKKMLTHNMLMQSEGRGAGVAVGASYHRWGHAFTAGSLGDGAPTPDANATKAYAVATRVLTDGARSWSLLGSGGLMYIGLDADGGRVQSLTRPFVGLQAVWVGTVMGLEYRWDDPSIDKKPVFSAAIRQVLSDEVTAELGTTNASLVGTGLSAQRLFLRVSRCL